MIKHDCLVDEVSPLVARHCLDDGHHFLGGVKEAGFGVLLFASAALAGAAPLRLFFIVLFHNSKNMFIFAFENPKVGGFPLLVGCQIQTSNLILTFQILTEIATLIRLSGFHFSYSFQGFRIPLCCSLTTLQRYENNLILPNFFKIILRKMQDFSMLKSFNYVWSM